jgi:hypothetical protein
LFIKQIYRPNRADARDFPSMRLCAYVRLGCKSRYILERLGILGS